MPPKHVPVEERKRLPARTSPPHYCRAVRLGVVVPALALALASCKKSETATPADQAPADTASTSQGEAPQPAPAPDAAPGPETASSPEAAPDMQAAASTGSGETSAAEGPTTAAQPAGGQPAARTPSVTTTEAASAPAPSPAAAPSAPAPQPESSAPADTPSAGGQQAGGGAQGGEAGGGAQSKQASLNATPEVYQGWKNFSANCERCHGQDAVGSSFAPSLLKSISEGNMLGTGPLNHDVFIGTVVAGRPAKGMPAWVQLLDRDQMESIWAYLSARASGQLAPGRPIRQGG